jgi:gliding motility-associated-like protein
MWHVFDAALIPDFSTVIFDRSGKFICNLWSYSQGWDGTYLGNKLPADDYWFVLYYTENGVSKTHRSHFSLKR